MLFHSNDIIMNQNNLDERREEEKVKSVCSFRKREYECVYVYAWRNYIFFIISSSLFSLDHFNDIVYLRTCVPSWLINFVVCDFFFLCVNSHHMKRVECRCIQTDFAYCVSMIHVRVKTVERRTLKLFYTHYRITFFINICSQNYEFNINFQRLNFMASPPTLPDWPKKQFQHVFQKQSQPKKMWNVRGWVIINK